MCNDLAFIGRERLLEIAKQHPEIMRRPPYKATLTLDNFEEALTNVWTTWCKEIISDGNKQYKGLCKTNPELAKQVDAIAEEWAKNWKGKYGAPHE